MAEKSLGVCDVARLTREPCEMVLNRRMWQFLHQSLNVPKKDQYWSLSKRTGRTDLLEKSQVLLELVSRFVARVCHVVSGYVGDVDD